MLPRRGCFLPKRRRKNSPDLLRRGWRHVRRRNCRHPADRPARHPDSPARVDTTKAAGRGRPAVICTRPTRRSGPPLCARPAYSKVELRIACDGGRLLGEAAVAQQRVGRVSFISSLERVDSPIELLLRGASLLQEPFRVFSVLARHPKGLQLPSKGGDSPQLRSENGRRTLQLLALREVRPLNFACTFACPQPYDPYAELTA
jgi:hypothetical protein